MRSRPARLQYAAPNLLLCSDEPLVPASSELGEKIRETASKLRRTEGKRRADRWERAARREAKADAIAQCLNQFIIRLKPSPVLFIPDRCYLQLRPCTQPGTIVVTIYRWRIARRITVGYRKQRARCTTCARTSLPSAHARFLTDASDVWSQNAWDHVPPPDDQSERIEASLARQRAAPVPEEEKAKYNEKPAKHWDNFYKNNAGNFFRNRKWLHLEFPELVAASQAEAGPCTIVEVGCGAGNAVLPLIAANANPHLRFHAYDYASHAIKVVQNHPTYLSPPAGTISAAVWDLTNPSLPADLTPGTADIVILVFVLSALHPVEWAQAVSNIHKILKPGGLLLFRDYGRHDLTQLRFKAGRLLEDNFYIRGDKTRVYFFDLDELAMMFTGRAATASEKTVRTTEVDEDDDEGDSGAVPFSPASSSAPGTPSEVQEPTPLSFSSSPKGQLGTASHPPPTDTTPASKPDISTLPATAQAALSALHSSGPLFSADQLGVDRRLLVNRKRQLKMYRVWMQAKFRKLDAGREHLTDSRAAKIEDGRDD